MERTEYTNNINYNVYDFDNLKEGYKLKMEHSVYINNDENGEDIENLISIPLNIINNMYDRSIMTEQNIFKEIKQVLKKWEAQAAYTQQLVKVLKYLNTPKSKHSSNKWEKDEYDKYTISNMVYKMTYNIYERSNYRTGKPIWDVRWHVYTNSPHNNYNVKVADQERSFPDKESAEKYVQGRIKAYSHLFTEISPPIPKEYIEAFKVNGILLPGYREEIPE